MFSSLANYALCFMYVNYKYTQLLKLIALYCAYLYTPTSFHGHQFTFVQCRETVKCTRKPTLHFRYYICTIAHILTD